MPVQLYFNHNVRGAVATGLRRRGVDVLTAFEDGAHAMEDPALLDRSSGVNRVLFTNDDDLVAEAVLRQRTGEHFRGVIYVHQDRLTIGETISELELIAKVSQPEELADRIVFLPL